MIRVQSEYQRVQLVVRGNDRASTRRACRNSIEALHIKMKQVSRGKSCASGGARSFCRYILRRLRRYRPHRRTRVRTDSVVYRGRLFASVAAALTMTGGNHSVSRLRGMMNHCSSKYVPFECVHAPLFSRLCQVSVSCLCTMSHISWTRGRVITMGDGPFALHPCKVQSNERSTFADSFRPSFDIVAAYFSSIGHRPSIRHLILR